MINMDESASFAQTYDKTNAEGKKFPKKIKNF